MFKIYQIHEMYGEYEDYTEYDNVYYEIQEAEVEE